MNKEEIIKHWEIIVNTVLCAEHNVYDQLSTLITSARNMYTPEVKNKYIRIIAEEIVKATPEEELLESYKDL